MSLFVSSGFLKIKKWSIIFFKHVFLSFYDCVVSRASVGQLFKCWPAEPVILSSNPAGGGILFSHKWGFVAYHIPLSPFYLFGDSKGHKSASHPSCVGSFYLGIKQTTPLHLKNLHDIKLFKSLEIEINGKLYTMFTENIVDNTNHFCSTVQFLCLLGLIHSSAPLFLRTIQGGFIELF